MYNEQFITLEMPRWSASVSRHRLSSSDRSASRSTSRGCADRPWTLTAPSTHQQRLVDELFSMKIRWLKSSRRWTYTLWFKKNAPTLADYNYDSVQSILIIFSRLFVNDHKSCLVVKFSTSPHICCHYTLWNTMLYFSLITLLSAKKCANICAVRWKILQPDNFYDR